MNSLAKRLSLVLLKIVPFHPNCSSISFDFSKSLSLFLPHKFHKLVWVWPDRGFGKYWGAVELDGGRSVGGASAPRGGGGDPDGAEGPEDTRPGTPIFGSHFQLYFLGVGRVLMLMWGCVLEG